ncbi:MAG: shikimate dehydrogenase family protein [Aristaeellaceae bacterium]
MKHYALIGEHLGHSMSVPIHEAIFRRLGIDADYRLVELPRDGFAQGARRLMDEVDGFNITIPYKQDIMPLLDAVDDAAQTIGAVNTVALNGRAIGYNTDVPGFAAMLRMHGIDPAGQPCYVLGTGGASKAVVAALRRMGAAQVTLVSRTPKGDDTIDYARLTDEFSGVLVNTTPAGMLYQQDTCPIREDALPGILRRATGVADIIYNPPETVLTRAAKSMGVPACTGMTMLIAQAVEAESIWQGYPMPANLTQTLDKELKLL